MVIRLAIKEDLEEMVRIEYEAFGSIAFNRRQFKYYIKNGMAYVVSASGGVYGHIVLFVRRNSSQVYINVIAIDAAFRGRGWGSALLQEMEKLYLFKGYTKMVLHVNETNIRAIGLYKLRGYDVVGRIPNCYGEGTVGIKMIKNLR